MTFFDILYNYRHSFPNEVIFEDEQYGEYTFSYIDEASARIYAYLTERNISTDDVVTVRMKRSARIFIVMLGVWKAGAAISVIGEHSPKNYADKVLADTAPKVLFDDDTFEEAMKCDVKEGYKTTDETDLCSIVYSTGSGGIFKGSMHEFGVINDATEWYLENMGAEITVRGKGLFLSGFYTIAAVATIISVIIRREYLYIVPHEKIGNEREIAKLVEEKECMHLACAPKLVNYLKKVAPPSLKALFSYYDTLDNYEDAGTLVFNSYGLTEAFGEVTYFRVDKAYDIVPIGKPYHPELMTLLDDEDKPVGKNEIGEICFVPVYFKGYRNNPELTAKAIYNGRFHTGDMAYLNEQDDYVFLGRKIDMIKTEKGYVVPNLISVAAKKKFPRAESVFVKLFGDSEHYKVCLYYCGAEEYGISDFQRELSGSVPDYMLPTHCLRMDKFEYFPSGKVNRLSFKEID